MDFLRYIEIETNSFFYFYELIEFDKENWLFCARMLITLHCAK